jgi:hypothetical protein
MKLRLPFYINIYRVPIIAYKVWDQNGSTSGIKEFILGGGGGGDDDDDGDYDILRSDVHVFHNPSTMLMLVFCVNWKIIAKNKI